MAISFTDRQRQVIDTHGCNLLVSAAAGSGKTAVLVERIVKMVSDAEHPADIDRLLVVTFTNAAAAEMRERISAALNDRLAKEPENEHLQRQVTLLYNAQITTIDSFCLFVLRNQFHTIGLDPGFRIGEEGEMRLLRKDVLAQVLEEAYEQADPAFLNCMEYFSAGSRDEAVEEVVWKLYDFAMSMPFPEEWLKDRKEDYSLPGAEGARAGAGSREGADATDAEQTDAPCGFPEWMQDMLDHVRHLLCDCADKLQAAIRLTEEPDGPYHYGPLLERELDMVKALRDRCAQERCDKADADQYGQEKIAGMAADQRVQESCEASSGDRYVQEKLVGISGDQYSQKINAPDYDALCGAFDSIQFERLPSKKDDSISVGKRELAKSLRNEVKEKLQEIRRDFFFQTRAQMEAQMTVCKEAVDGLVDLTLRFKETFDEKKREKNLLDFDDIEHFALEILLRKEADTYVPTQTALSYRSHFQEILIDEYQDSNLVQEYLLSCISGEAEGRFNRFMVGDVKQSIYKFRLARPELFLEKYETYTGKEMADGFMKIDLHQNFRSRQEVLTSTNRVFEQIMGKEVGGIVYDDLAALHVGASYPQQAGADTPRSGSDLETEVMCFNETELLLFQTKDKPEEISAREQEAYGVAAKIKQLRRDFHVTDKESGQLRKVAFRDIVILLRTVAGWDEVFKRVLEEEQIPVHMTSRTGYFAASEVQELLHFLRILDNPLQDIPLYGVLHSYLGGFTEEEIALIRAAYPKKKYLYDALVLCTGPKPAEEKTSGEILELTEGVMCGKITDFLERVARYRSLAAYLSVHELLQTILRETGYLHYVAAKPEGAKRRANVEMLLVKAAEYEKTSYFGLYHFLRYMEQLEKYEVDYGEAGLQDENADVVRIMSIHKSKGLEFPICIVAGLSKKFQTRDINGHLVVDVDAGIGVDYVNPQMRVRGRNLRRNVISARLKKENLAEEMRVLYVAMTRAREKLILTATVKDPEKTAVSLLSLQKRDKTTLSYGTLLAQDSFLSLLLAALARNRCLDEFYVTCGLEPYRQGKYYEADMSIRVTLSGWEAVVEEKVEDTLQREEARRRILLSDARRDVDEDLMTRMSYQFTYQYPHDNLKDLYTKTTVSELKKAGMQEERDFSFNLYEEETVVPYLPKFIETDEHVTGSMRGSAFHKVMELFEFTELTKEVNSNRQAAEELVKEQVDRMRQEQVLSEAYYQVLSIQRLAAFLQTEAAWRMAQAARAGRLYKEQPFVMGLSAERLKASFPPAETVLIQGIIDVFFEEEDGYVVLDYKTDAVERPEELIKRYQVQLAYYSEVLEQLSGYAKGKNGKRVKERIIYSFRLGQEIPV